MGSACLTMASASRSRTEVGMTSQGHKIARHEMCYFCFDVLYCHLYNLQPPQQPTRRQPLFCQRCLWPKVGTKFRLLTACSEKAAGGARSLLKFEAKVAGRALTRDQNCTGAF